MAVVGGFGDLERLIRKVGTVASAESRAKVAKQLAHEALTQVKLGFSQSVAPDDASWAPLKYRKGKPLRDTGRLANSFGVLREGPDGFTVGTNVAYAAYHQTGTRHMPARPMVPAGGLPPRYADAFTDLLETYLAKHFK